MAGPAAADDTQPPPQGGSPELTAPPVEPLPAPAPPPAAEQPATPAATEQPAPPPPAAPAPAPAAADPVLDAAPMPAAPRPPFYQRTWFWTVLGVAAVTAVAVWIGMSSEGPATPDTNLGNMRAF